MSNQIIHFNEKVFYENAFKELDVEILVDSSKELSWLWDMRDLFKNCIDIEHKYILLYKKPEAIAYSAWKRGRSIDGAIKNYMNYYKHFFRLGVPYFSVSFESLCNNPKESLQQICELCDLSFDSNMVTFWQKGKKICSVIKVFFVIFHELQTYKYTSIFHLKISV